MMMRHLYWGLVLAGFAGWLIGCASQVPAVVPTDTPASSAMATPNPTWFADLSTNLFLESPSSNITPVAEPLVLRSRLARLNLTLLAALGSPQADPTAGHPGTVPLNLFPDATYIAIADRVTMNPNGLVWLGHLDRIASSQVTLIVANNLLTGTIRLPGKLYQVRFAGNDLYSISQIDPKAFPPD